MLRTETAVWLAASASVVAPVPTPPACEFQITWNASIYVGFYPIPAIRLLNPKTPPQNTTPAFPPPPPHTPP